MVAQTELVSFATWFTASLVGHILLRLVWGATAAKVICKAKKKRREMTIMKMKRKKKRLLLRKNNNRLDFMIKI